MELSRTAATSANDLDTSQPTAVPRHHSKTLVVAEAEAATEEASNLLGAQTRGEARYHWTRSIKEKSATGAATRITLRVSAVAKQRANQGHLTPTQIVVADNAIEATFGQLGIATKNLKSNYSDHPILF